MLSNNISQTVTEVIIIYKAMKGLRVVVMGVLQQESISPKLSVKRMMSSIDIWSPQLFR